MKIIHKIIVISDLISDDLLAVGEHVHHARHPLRIAKH